MIRIDRTIYAFSADYYPKSGKQLRLSEVILSIPAQRSP
jgi:hypothetical protein